MHQRLLARSPHFPPPGHYIHYDEWVSSPVFKGSSIALESGMAIQCDVIPGTGTEYFSSNIEVPSHGLPGAM